MSTVRQKRVWVSSTTTDSSSPRLVRASKSQSALDWYANAPQFPRRQASRLGLFPSCTPQVHSSVSFTVPRLANDLLPGFVSTVSVNAAIGFYSAIASGMIALTAIVFSLTFVMVQFSATAYSPRHSLGLIGVAQAGFPFQAYSWWAYFSLSAS
jgi:hypothetical protein